MFWLPVSLKTPFIEVFRHKCSFALMRPPNFGLFIERAEAVPKEAGYDPLLTMLLRADSSNCW